MLYFGLREQIFNQDSENIPCKKKKKPNILTDSEPELDFTNVWYDYEACRKSAS